jgi:hypothetical protein
VNGKQLSDAAVALARTKGYIAAHFRQAPSRSGFITPYSYDSKGFPDLILVGRKMLAVEVKGDGDSLRVEQKAWLAAFEKAGIETFVLTSKAWRAGELEELL